MQGCSFFQEIEQTLKLSNRISKLLPDHRDPDKITYQQKYMVKQRCFGQYQLRLLLSTFACLMMDRFRTVILYGTEWAKLQCSTLRTKLIKIGAVVTRNTRRVRLHLNSAYPYQELFAKAHSRLMSG